MKLGQRARSAVAAPGQQGYGQVMPRQALLSDISAKIQDYRQGEWEGPSPAHVDRWISQFDANAQMNLLAELNHILSKYYISRATATQFLTNLAQNAKLTSGDPSAFWQTVGILNIQRGGSSQREMRMEFDQVLQGTVGYGVAQCQPTSGHFVYLDDAVFSGTRLRTDLEGWLPLAPANAQVHVVTMGLHRGGEWYATSKFAQAAKATGKKVDLKFWRCVEMEDRLRYTDSADVLRPSAIPPDPAVQTYVQNLIALDAKYAPRLRSVPGIGEHTVFSSAPSRDTFEQEMLKTGAQIRDMCPNLPDSMRPLGFTGLHTLGFGAVLVTYRNCPNNCPLAYWVDHPWYPLFPRKTNAQARQ